MNALFQESVQASRQHCGIVLERGVKHWGSVGEDRAAFPFTGVIQVHALPAQASVLELAHRLDYHC